MVHPAGPMPALAGHVRQYMLILPARPLDVVIFLKYLDLELWTHCSQNHNSRPPPLGRKKKWSSRFMMRRSAQDLNQTTQHEDATPHSDRAV